MQYEFLDLLTLAACDIGMVKKNINPKCGIGALASTFGPLAGPLAELLTAAPLPMARIHLGNGSCLRLNRCEKGEPKYRDFKTITKRAVVFNEMAAKYPSTKFYLSPFVEYGETDSGVVKEWFKIIEYYAPKCVGVASPLGGWSPSYVLQESHGPKAGGDFTSGDGWSNYDSPFSQWSKNARVGAGFWDYPFNRNKRGGPWIPPSKRTILPTANDIRKAMKAMGL